MKKTIAIFGLALLVTATAGAELSQASNVRNHGVNFCLGRPSIMCSHRPGDKPSDPMDLGSAQGGVIVGNIPRFNSNVRDHRGSNFGGNVRDNRCNPDLSPIHCKTSTVTGGPDF